MDTFQTAIINNGTNNGIYHNNDQVTEAKYENTTQFSFTGGTMPAANTWTVSDISSVTGANRAMVFLRVANATGSTATFGFRENGDAIEAFPATQIGPASNVITLQNGESGYAWAPTDTTGKLQVVTSVSAGTFAFKVLIHYRVY